MSGDLDLHQNNLEKSVYHVVFVDIALNGPSNIYAQLACANILIIYQSFYLFPYFRNKLTPKV